MNICRNKGDVVKLYCIPQFIEFAKKLAVKIINNKKTALMLSP
jgi:hypothetical protein